MWSRIYLYFFRVKICAWHWLVNVKNNVNKTSKLAWCSTLARSVFRIVRILTLGGSVTEDKDFNESSIPNDWAKARESESPQICQATKQACQFTAVFTYKFIISLLYNKNQATWQGQIAVKRNYWRIFWVVWRPFIYVTHFHQKRCYVRDVFSALF